MAIGFLLDRFREHAGREAVVWRSRSFSYGWLLEAVARRRRSLDEDGPPAGSVVSLEADYSPDVIALLLALAERQAVVVPLAASVEAQKPRLRATAQVEVVFDSSAPGPLRFQPTGTRAHHPLLRRLRQAARPGLVLFSSGSTGESKAVLHDLATLLEKFRLRRHAYCTLPFLLFDHIGGLNTLLYTLANGGTLVVVEERSPERVCRAVAEHRVQLLPTSPTFLNLLLASEAWRHHDLSSLELVTYGTEVMPESTLRRLRELLPRARLLQTYGLSEVGILRSKSRSSDSLWMKVGGEGFETRVVDGMLQVRARSSMLGYLNAPSPFTAGGWLPTGDEVEVDGEYLRILGRRSEIINVGGEKVYPSEVEGALLAMDGVEEAAVTGEANAITGQLVRARVRLSTQESAREFRTRMHRFLKDRLPRHKIPQKVTLAAEALHGERFKLRRR